MQYGNVIMEQHQPAPSFLVQLLHSVPHINITLHRVNDTFNPNSTIYIESLGILASIPAALLIISLVFLLLYLLTRCCDRKPRKHKSHGCQKCTLIFFAVVCCGAIGLGLYGNDDLHNGVLQIFGSGRKIEQLILNVRNQTELVKHNLKSKVVLSELEQIFEQPPHRPNVTAHYLLHDSVKMAKDNTTLAINALETIVYLTRPAYTDITLKSLLDTYEFYEELRWPITLGFLTFLLLLCIILMIGATRSSRCALIFFSVCGLLAVTVCWLLSGIYLASAVALGDFCMKPNDFICSHPKLKDVQYTYCSTVGTNRYVLRLNESKVHVDRAKESLETVNGIGMDLYPGIQISSKVNKINGELDDSKRQLTALSVMLDRRTVAEHYADATRSLCEGGLLGLTLMLLASLVSAAILSLLVCVDSHTWIYLTKKRPGYEDKAETTPLFPAGTNASPSAPIIASGTMTVNRTLLHAQTATTNGATSGGGGGIGAGGIGATGTLIPSSGRNGTTHGMRGFATYSGDESPPPDYNVVVHDNRASGHHTLGRLPSQHAPIMGPNNGKYATLSKQCKTLESNDFY
ncbi:protein tweety-2-like isoform X1 [Anopheles albimanus]|uniref:protein tweety-2-like isoform X1 n=1 Tax=Anopheles albimanus TaxID=7167 RepID=UPI00163F882E|nr:protein tweety-2-like isoform X1 [Anopheles albimanus]XP_035779421.1 protein tweety-2-like isoform X1 [Anopheles albimanus]XP_035779422.1 protein tweety-2-like isoform X1 [Anopheles albimanus]XP_035779423.1 protein tweety-2-like isoform X1 [Anopheles albimanus]